MLEKLIEITQEKHQIDVTRNSWYQGSQTYFENIQGELAEVQEELKDNNIVHLEDELGDILWTYMLLLEGLEKEGKISSREKVISRAETKYRERIDHIKKAMDDEGKSEAWKEIKALQKQKLAEEHKKIYPN